MFCDSSFWKSLPGPNILIFQADSFLLDDTIDRWLEYDYVGAPYAEWLRLVLRVEVGSYA